VSAVVTRLKKKQNVVKYFSMMPLYKVPHDLRAKKEQTGQTQSGRGYNYNSSLQMGQNNRNGITPSSAQHMFQTEECCTRGLQKIHMLRRQFL
jgi:hypothetical protein